VVKPRAHPLAARTGISLDEVSGYAMVSLPRESQTRRLIDGLASASGLTLQHVVTVNQFATVMQCVHAGVGLAILPGAAVPSAVRAGLASKPLTKPAVTRTIGAVLLKDRSLTPSARGFQAQLKGDWSESASGARARKQR
jgi:DNA-binding transcriptional LysR family regulator